MAKIFEAKNRIKQTATYDDDVGRFWLATGAADGYSTLQTNYGDAQYPVVYWATSASGVWEVNVGRIFSATGGDYIMRTHSIAGEGPFADETAVTLTVGPHAKHGNSAFMCLHAEDQSISNNSLTTVTGWTEKAAGDMQEAGGFEYLPGYAGGFRVSVLAKWANATGGTKRQILIRTAATGYDYLFQEGVVGTQVATTPILSILDTDGVVARDRVQVQVLQDTGGSVDVDVDLSVEVYPGGKDTFAPD